MRKVPLAPALLAEAEDVAEQVLRALARQEVLLVLGALIGVARRDRDVDAEIGRKIEIVGDLLGRHVVEDRRVDVDLETGVLRRLDRLDRDLERSLLVDGAVVLLLETVEMDREEQERRRLEEVQLLFEQQRIGAQRHELLARDDAGDDLADVLVNERLAARDRDDRRPALVDRLQALIDRKALVEDRRRIVDLAAARASEIAAEERLKKKDERIALSAHQRLLQNISAYAELLVKRNGHPRLLRSNEKGLNCSGGFNGPGVHRVFWARHVGEFGGQLEVNVLAHAVERLDADGANGTQLGDRFLNKSFGRRRARRDSDRLHALEPGEIEHAGVLDEISGKPEILADLAQPVRVRGVVGPDDEEKVDLLAELDDGGLPVLRRIADVAGVWADDRGKARLQRRDHVLGVVDRQRRLRDERDAFGIADGKRRDLMRFGNHVHDAGDLTERTLDLRVAEMADEHDVVSLLGVPAAFLVDLRHQRAGRIDNVEVAEFRAALHLLRHAMRGEDCNRAGRHFVDFLDEDRAAVPERIDDALVVHDFVADIDRRAIFLERALDDVDRPLNAGAKAARLRENDLQTGSLLSHRRASLHCPLPLVRLLGPDLVKSVYSMRFRRQQPKSPARRSTNLTYSSRRIAAVQYHCPPPPAPRLRWRRASG